MKPDLLSLTYEELEGMIISLGQPKFRTGQLYSWLHQNLATSYDEMTNVPKVLKEKLSDTFEAFPLSLVTYQESKLDGTRKYLFKLSDGNLIESVWMKYHHGNSVCISSQAGCRMGCRFCASTIDGLARSLTAGEMLAQIYLISRHTNERVSNVVIMGSGEPLDNFDQVIKFLELISSPKGLNISKRNLTLSTCGIVPKIYELADLCLPITLAISLHASNDATRRELMPVANAYSMEELLNACHYYFEKTGRRLTFEYSLVLGVNDTVPQAMELGKLLHQRLDSCHVNLIPVNPVKEREYRQSLPASVAEFKKTLEKYGINATIRREMGRDIDGACGQLRKRFMDEPD